MADSLRLAKHDETNDANHMRVKITLLLTSTFTVMAGATVSPALPAMQSAFEGFPNVELWIRLVLTLPALFIAVGAPIAGYIVDRFGRKNILIGSMMLYGLAGGSGLFAESLPLILAGRALLGISVAGLMTSVTTLIADYYSGPQRSAFIGLQTAFMGLGGTTFLTVGGVLADIGWRMPFGIYLTVFLVLPLVVMMLYEPPKRTNDASTVITSDEPTGGFPIALMTFIYSAVILIQMVFYLIPVNLPFYLENLLNANATTSGLAIAAMTLAFAICASMAGWFDKHMSHIQAVMAAFVVTGIAYALIGSATNWTLIAIGLPLGGFGIGLMMPNLNVWLANSTPFALRGRALGGFGTSVFLGQFLSPIFAQPLIQSAGIAGTYILVGGGLVVIASALLLFRKQLNKLGT